MIYLKRSAWLLLLILVSQSQTPTSSCPQLCTQNCVTTSSSCSSCYSSFLSTASPGQSCSSCPTSMYRDSNKWCQFCPTTCLACTSSSQCTSCIPGYMLYNNYECRRNITNDNGWTSIGVFGDYGEESIMTDILESSVTVYVNNTLITLTDPRASQHQYYETECGPLTT